MVSVVERRGKGELSDGGELSNQTNARVWERVDRRYHYCYCVGFFCLKQRFGPPQTTSANVSVLVFFLDTLCFITIFNILPVAAVKIIQTQSLSTQALG